MHPHIVRVELVVNGVEQRINFDLAYSDAGQSIANVTDRDFSFLASDVSLDYRTAEARSEIISSAVSILRDLLNKEFSKLDTLDGYPIK
jgi:hypothetical protein